MAITVDHSTIHLERTRAPGAGRPERTNLATTSNVAAVTILRDVADQFRAGAVLIRKTG
jgi:hypothetical protein